MPITLLVLALLSLTILTTEAQSPSYIGDDCKSSTEQALSSTYQTNVNKILSWLTSSVGTSKGYNHTTIGTGTNDTVYGLFDCRGDVDISFCQFCISTAQREMLTRCPNRVSAEMWYDYCILRYSNQDFIGNVTLQPNWIYFGSKNISNPTEFNTSENYIRSLIRIATKETNQLYGMGDFYLSNGEKRYGMVQCSRDLSNEGCAQCLEAMLGKVPQCCVQKLGWEVVVPSCLVRYQDYIFYANNGHTTPSPVPDSPTAKQGGNSKSRTLIISIISALAAVALLSCSTYYFFCRNRVKEETTLLTFHGNVESENSYEDLYAIPFMIIQQSTNNFSEAFKLGEGGFGHVYKGILPDGREIAVKRLSQSSGQGFQEFKNEIICGQRNNELFVSKYGDGLLIYIWKLWCEGKSLELMDSTLEKSYIDNEVTRCIHIGLLCVQEDAADRPTMSDVVVMLASDTMALPNPNHPAFSVGRRVIEEESASKASNPSINEVTMSHIAPR
ncbi:hypothetical protein L6164_023199 [Bauhinia variegata]|uniref:Uncharacterized protein n=1 Tax=Bauhinia variegata TaxID=167791 RepID=A0ACB9MIV4_BAUVA|nr:hypothetical protein L6164_023199 [Bauhinia variegata]